MIIYPYTTVYYILYTLILYPIPYVPYLILYTLQQVYYILYPIYTLYTILYPIPYILYPIYYISYMLFALPEWPSNTGGNPTTTTAQLASTDGVVHLERAPATPYTTIFGCQNVWYGIYHGI